MTRVSRRPTTPQKAPPSDSDGGASSHPAKRIVFRRPPLLILVMGVAGSGKTRLSRALLARVEAAYLDKDELCDAFFPDRRDGDDYRALRPALYRALYRLAASNLAAGNTVLVDAPHVKEASSADWWRRMEELAAGSGAKLAVVRCSCDEGTLRRRLRARGEPRDRAKLESWPEFLREQPGRAPLPYADVLEVDTEADSEVAAVERVVEYLSGVAAG